jgi:tyrosine-protein kinase Etk/Wzc
MQQNLEDDSIDIKKIFVKLLDKWYWILTSLVICCFVAFLYSQYTPPIYQINSRLLVTDDEKGGGMGKANAMMDLGGLLGSTNSVDNEAEILQTRFLMEQVVREMQLNIVYLKKNSLVKRELNQSPFKLSIIKAVDTIKPVRLTVKKLSGNKVNVISGDFQKDVNWNETFHINEIGSVKLSPEAGINMLNDDYYVKVTSIDQKVGDFLKRLSVGVSNKQVTIIDMNLSYEVPKKGEDILNMLISKYIQANLGDKNAIADSTAKFIKERITIIASELGDVENKVESFKKTNKLSDMSEQGKLLVESTGEFTTELAKAETQVAVLDGLEKYLQDETKNKRVFPTSLLPQDMVFSGLMSQYNLLLIERDKQLLSVTEESPFIKNIDIQIAGLRSGILANIQSTKNTYVLTRNKLRGQLAQAENQITGIPQIEKNYLKLARNQQIKQELYIFLMQKAEETAISKTSNISVAKIIDPPKSEVIPISPKKGIIYLLGLVVGLLLPVIILITVDMMNTSILSKEDIESRTQVSVIGEINHNDSPDNLIVANHGRSAISEQFRALRTNLSFYLKSSDEKVILLTSSMSGEGKSFTAINLGNILALAGNKVLLMELDLRKPGLSAKLDMPNTVGYTNYTINSEMKSSEIVRPLNINKNLFLISSGPLPPNPAETLMSSRAQQLIDELKSEFDYIIMDAPPIGIITDAQLLSKYADATLYIVRQKVTQKHQIAIVEDLFKANKMKNLGIVVNDIVSKYYGDGYGSYGNYGEEEQENWYNKLISKFRK